MNKGPVWVSAGVYLLIAMMLLLLPLQWVIAACAAALFHEFCHIAAVWACAGKIQGIRIGNSGAVINAGYLGEKATLFCLLAGPAGGLLLLLFARWIPRIAVCAAVHALYNLLPVEPLDGGRALRCATEWLIPNKAEGICFLAERCCLLGLFAIALYGCLWLKLGLFPLVLALCLILKAKSAKIPCKPTSLALQ